MRTARKQTLALTLSAMGLCLLSSTNLRAQDAAALQAMDAPAGALWADSLNITTILQGYGSPHAGKSVDNNPITLHGVVYSHGIGTHAHSEMLINLKGAAQNLLRWSAWTTRRRTAPVRSPSRCWWTARRSSLPV